MTSPVARLHDYGQSPWYDNLGRRLIADGGLARLVTDHGIRGVTSNPTIFEKAISAGEEYDAAIAHLGEGPLAGEGIAWELVIADVEAACEVLRPTFEESGGDDGFVSIEVAPGLADDTDATIVQARQLHERIGRPNLMVKIPGTAAGIPAIEEMTAEGRRINVTLIFSLERYEEVIEAYLRGLERWLETGGDPRQVASVASFFVSRVDTEADKRIPEGHPLRGRVAVANAKLAYALFRERFSGERWARLAAAGARLQRPLWASTSTKNPAYSDTLYVDELVGRDTVNTLAPPSIAALSDHGDPQPDTVEAGLEEARAVVGGLAGVGVDYDDLTEALERQGVDAFAASYHDLVSAVDKRRSELVRN